jgi:hypothetical protein
MAELTGREMDAWIAEHIIGIPKELISIDGPIDYFAPGHTSPTKVAEVDHYYTDEDSAGYAVDVWMAAHPMWTFEVAFDPRYKERGWRARSSMWTPDKGINLYDCGVVRDGSTRPAAICRALHALYAQEASHG